MQSACIMFCLSADLSPYTVHVGSDVLKCPITCEVLKDPVVAAGTVILTDIDIVSY